ncbi:hypothetical protein [Moosepox virus GoldyGopher14]|nr:hypothetical protein [Moosepox virus GoldyGopher14]AYC44711.1 hypothetical protein [Moosepox virus GoldyGopher14]
MEHQHHIVNYAYCDEFTESDDITVAVADYLYWSSKEFRSRDRAGNVFVALESFKQEAIEVFGKDLTTFVKLLFLDSKEGFNHAKSFITLSLERENLTQEACAIVGLLAKAAEYWGGEPIPTRASAKVLMLLGELLTFEDLTSVKATLINRMIKI